MANVYSTCFFDGNIVGGAEASIFTVPSGLVYIIRDADMCAYPSGATDAYFISTGGGNPWAVFGMSGTGSVATWRGRQVYEAGSTFNVLSTPNELQLRVSGYILTSP